MICNSKFVYTIYIRSIPERVWEAIIKPEVTKQYWGHENISNWQQGSEWLHITDDNKRTIKLVGEVIKIIPNKLLMLTWADPVNVKDNSTVTFEIESVKEATCLKVIHNNFKANSKMFEMIKIGWPRVISSMKSFLETGKALKTWDH